MKREPDSLAVARARLAAPTDELEGQDTGRWV